MHPIKRIKYSYEGARIELNNKHPLFFHYTSELLPIGIDALWKTIWIQSWKL